MTTAIDEAQLVPEIFPALKEAVRVRKSPGQYVLSGSIRFTSKKSIKESLTGRILNIELLPLSLSEIASRELPNHLIRFLKGTSSEIFADTQSLRERKHLSDLIEKYSERGGLPGVFFIRDEKIRLQKIEDQIDTIVDRDLRQIISTSLPMSQLKNLLEAIAKRESEPLSLVDLKKETQISTQTIKKMFFAFEATFILRWLKLEGDLKGHVALFEDHLEMKHLSKNSTSPLSQWSGLLYRNLREQFYYSEGLSFSFFQYRKRGNALVPFAVQTKEGTIGFIPFLKSPTRSQLLSGKSFLSAFNNSKLIYIGDDPQHYENINDRECIVPAHRILF